MATLLWAFLEYSLLLGMGLLLALWMGISSLGSCTFVPALLVLLKPKFFLRAAQEGITDIMRNNIFSCSQPPFAVTHAKIV